MRASLEALQIVFQIFFGPFAKILGELIDTVRSETALATMDWQRICVNRDLTMLQSWVRDGVADFRFVDRLRLDLGNSIHKVILAVRPFVCLMTHSPEIGIVLGAIKTAVTRAQASCMRDSVCLIACV